MPQQRPERENNRVALWEKRGNNPPNAIGYVDKKTREVFTAHGSYSAPVRETNLTTRQLRSGFHPGYLPNKAHERRMAAILKGDNDGDYTYYYG